MILFQLKKLLPLFFGILGLSSLYGQSNPCSQLQSYKIVVLGSSTAAGAGVSNSDSAWVNRYRTYLENINPNNEVINLAVGGYNTYKIMPTGFVQPTNRPAPDVNKNITAALAENPDAIIVNMPSNDVSAGYNYAEQMFNLDSVFLHSNANGVPVWICTTQPRNFSDTTKLNLQFKLKDSIQSVFDPFTIDFWTAIAEVDHTINPSFNSGDGVHLNDSAHALLNERVQAANILNYLYNSPNSVDYALFSIIDNFTSNCGDSSAHLKVIIANQGILDSLNGNVIINVQNLSNGINSSQSLTLLPIPSCEIDTLDFFINTYEAGNYHVFVSIDAQNDTSNTNDTLSFFTSTTGRPSEMILRDTLCEPGSGGIIIPTVPGDSSFWYQHIGDTIPFHFGNSFQSPFISSTQTWYVESVRGSLFNNNHLQTTQNSNINFNGAMLNITPQTDIFIDSVGLKILNTGMKSVDIYYKMGSYIGHENNANSWTLLTTSIANVTDSLAFTYYSVPTLSLQAFDTIGFYFQMTNAQDKLGYQSMSASQTRTNDHLSIYTGSGIGHNFTNSYFPRDLNCDFRYHHENTSYGICNSGRFPATIYVSDFTLNIGNDTIIDLLDSLTIFVPQYITNWTWSNGSTDTSIIISASELGPGVHYVSLNATDSLDCLQSDEMVVAVADLVGLENENKARIHVYPNPSNNFIYSNIGDVETIDLFSIAGKKLFQFSQFPIDISQIAQGSYLLQINTSASESYCIKILKN